LAIGSVMSCGPSGRNSLSRSLGRFRVEPKHLMLEVIWARA
jgi:hypothetical protein